MIEKLLSHTSLPNLHPAIVHFPIALLTAAVAFDLACLIGRRQAWLDRCAAALYGLGALGAWAAYLAGEEAEESLGRIPAAVDTLIEAHQDWAFRALLTFAFVALARITLTWWEHHPERPRRLALRAIVILAALGGLWLLFETADRGGALVYRHGVAVTPSSVPVPSRRTGTGSGD